MYAREVARREHDETVYEDVDARTIQLLQNQLAKRSQAKKPVPEAAAEPAGLHPELIR